jgi:RNA polymerase sigma-70 factor (ECF subfamily)
MSRPELDSKLRDGVHEAWLAFCDAIEPLRPELFRFCLRLTGSAFDAEDLVHDGMLRAFGALSAHRNQIENPRAYMLRIVTNLWIDEKRRARPIPSEETESLPDPTSARPSARSELRDAAETLLGSLTPRERAAVVLKDAFDLSHAQIAELLSTTAGAVKVALHRGRRRLAEERAESVAPATPRVSRALVDRFVETFLTYDMHAVAALLVENVEADVFPSGVGVGREFAARKGWVHGCFYHHIPEREAKREPMPLRLEVREIDGEPVVLVLRDGVGGEALEEVWRFEEQDGQIARVRDYGFCPDLVHWVAEHFAVPFRPVGYRFRERIYERPRR